MRAVCRVFVQVCAAAGACVSFAAACQLVAGVGEKTFDYGDASSSRNGGGGFAGAGGVYLDSGSGGVQTGPPDVAHAAEAAPPDVNRSIEAGVEEGPPDTALEGGAGQVGVIDAGEDGPLRQTITVGFDTPDVFESFYFSTPEILGAGKWGWDPDPDPHIVQLENVSSYVGTNAIYQGRELRDGRVSVHMWTTDVDSYGGGVIARYVDETQYYRVSVYEQELAIIKRVGVDQVLASRPIVYDLMSPGHTVKFEFIGPDLRFYVDDVLELQVTESSDSGGPSSGEVGIWCAWMRDAHFDDFTIESLDGP